MLRCERCSKTFKTPSGLDWHMDHQHPGATKNAGVRDDTQAQPSGVSDSATPPWTESVEKIQRVRSNSQTDKRSRGLHLNYDILCLRRAVLRVKGER